MMTPTDIDLIANQQLKALLQEQKDAVYQLIAKFYYQNLEERGDDGDRVAVTFKHDTDTHYISYYLSCPLERSPELLGQTREVCTKLVELYLSADQPADEVIQWPPDPDEDEGLQGDHGNQVNQGDQGDHGELRTGDPF